MSMQNCKLLCRYAVLSYHETYKSYSSKLLANLATRLWSFWSLLQADVEQALVGVTSVSDRGQVLTLTVDEIRHVLTVEEIGQVSMSDCCEMYTVSIPAGIGKAPIL